MCGKRSYPAFTLIELLIVIAIIALLCAILFPVFYAVKEGANSAMCSSNLRQLGQAFAMYASDKDGWFPSPGGHRTLLGEIGSGWIQSDGPGMGKDNGGIWPYVQQRGNGGMSNVWGCPHALPGPPWAYSPGQNYIMNDYLRCWHPGEERIYPFIKWNIPLQVEAYACGISPDNLIVSPSGIILLFEGAQHSSMHNTSRPGSPFFNTGASATPPLCKDMPQNYHHGRGNYLFCDLHVKALYAGKTWTAEDQPAFEKYNGPGYNECKTLAAILDLGGDYHGSADESMWNPRIPSVVYP